MIFQSIKKQTGGVVPPFVFMLILLMSLAGNVKAQRIIAPDTTGKVDSVYMPPHSAKTATWLSVILPGAGQVYNHKYWKVPIIYIGLGITGYLAYDNQQQFEFYRHQHVIAVNNEYALSLDPNAKTRPLDPLLQANHYTAADISGYEEYYRYDRDLSIIIFGVIYAFNIVDAAVDAHLFSFDVSDNLSCNFKPTAIYAYNSPLPYPGLSVNLSPRSSVSRTFRKYEDY